MNDRTGTVLVANTSYSITQKGKKCTYSLSPSSLNHPNGGANGSFSVTATSGCSWAAGTTDGWIHTGTSGSGSGTVNYSVDANTSVQSRTGSIAVGGQNFTVN